MCVGGLLKWREGQYGRGEGLREGGERWGWEWGGGGKEKGREVRGRRWVEGGERQGWEGGGLQPPDTAAFAEGGGGLGCARATDPGEMEVGVSGESQSREPIYRLCQAVGAGVIK